MRYAAPARRTRRHFLLLPLLTAAALSNWTLAAADDPPPNQASNSRMRLEGKAISKREDVKKFLGVDLGDGYIVIQVRAVPSTRDPIYVSPDDFTLISRKNGERGGALNPEHFAPSAEVASMLKSRAFPDQATLDPVEGLLYFQLDAKNLSPKNLGMVYSGPAGHLVIDFK